MKTIEKFTVLVLCTLMLALTACSGAALPEGMDEDALFAAGKNVMLLLVEGEYEAVYEMLREDQRSQFTVEDIEKVVSSQLNGAGYYKQIEDHMLTGQTIEGKKYAVSVLYCEFSEEDVLIRISFDDQMRLVGFALQQD